MGSHLREIALPSEVLAFAVEQGVDAYLAGVLAMTQRHFPRASRVQVQIEDDPEIPRDRHLVIEVNVPPLDAVEYADAKFRWGQELFQVCPASLVCVFRCALGVTES